MYTEDRDLFVKKLDEIAVKTPVSHAVGNLEDAVSSLRDRLPGHDPFRIRIGRYG